MKRKNTIILLMIGLLLAIFSLPTSGALSGTGLSRYTVARIASSDTTAALKLDGIHGTSLTISNINKKYFYLGTITNNSNQQLSITMTVTPDFSQLSTKNYWLGIQIGSGIIEFTSTSSPSQSLVFTLAPGQTETIYGALQGNQAREIILSFSFTATNTANGTYIVVKDTAANPRRVYVK